MLPVFGWNELPGWNDELDWNGDGVEPIVPDENPPVLDGEPVEPLLKPKVGR